MNFSVGDIMKKVYDKNYENAYRILSLRTEQQGNWHDGFYECIIATIELVADLFVPKEDFVLMYHAYGNTPVYYASLCGKIEICQQK